MVSVAAGVLTTVAGARVGAAEGAFVGVEGESVATTMITRGVGDGLGRSVGACPSQAANSKRAHSKPGNTANLVFHKGEGFMAAIVTTHP